MSVYPGDRVRVIAMPDDPAPLEPGTEGTVQSINDYGQISVAWDNGRSLMLLADVDTFEVVNLCFCCAGPVNECDCGGNGDA